MMGIMICEGNRDLRERKGMIMREVTYDSELANLLKTNKGIITTVNSIVNDFLYDSGHVNS